MYVAGGRGNFGLQALARSMHSASQAIVDIWIFVSIGSPCFYSHIPQSDACLGIGPTMAYCTAFFRMEFGTAQVESMDGHLYSWRFDTGGSNILFDYIGPALPVDGLESSPGADGLCWDYI